MTWYIHPSKQLRDDELPPELVVTNRDGSIEQAYVPERTCHMKYVPEWSGDELYPTECYACETCGYISQDGRHRYCAECGAKVVDE